MALPETEAASAPSYLREIFPSSSMQITTEERPRVRDESLLKKQRKKQRARDSRGEGDGERTPCCYPLFSGSRNMLALASHRPIHAFFPLSYAKIAGSCALSA